MNEIEVNSSRKKVNFISDTYQNELQCWKEAALKKTLIENEAKELTNLAPKKLQNRQRR